MKVTVTFGQTGVVVPCKEGWTVRELIQQATQRYRKLLEQVSSDATLRPSRVIRGNDPFPPNTCILMLELGRDGIYRFDMLECRREGSSLCSAASFLNRKILAENSEQECYTVISPRCDQERGQKRGKMSFRFFPGAFDLLSF